jgi:hypothetical protein
MKSTILTLLSITAVLYRILHPPFTEPTDQNPHIQEQTFDTCSLLQADIIPHYLKTLRTSLLLNSQQLSVTKRNNGITTTHVYRICNLVCRFHVDFPCINIPQFPLLLPSDKGMNH